VVRTLRRARELAAEGHYSLAEWLALLERYGHRCGYCGAVGKLEPDHRVPLSRGGSNWISNIIPACRRCNTRKRTAPETEYPGVPALQYPQADGAGDFSRVLIM